jgi:ribosomal protein L7/L12
MTPILATSLGFGDFAIIAWIVLVFAGASAAYSSRQSGLRRIEQKLDALLKHQGVSLPPQAKLSEEVQQLARDHHKIEALTLHREQTGLGLAEAKADVEDFIKTIQ